MKRIPCTFEAETGRFLHDPITGDVTQIVYGDKEAVIYEPGDELPPVAQSEPAEERDLAQELTDLKQALSDKGVITLIEGDDPNTPEIEKSYWTRILEFVGIK